ncbi:hypothetical protein Celaphus_00014599, partial [Cervus elaphus hippelaphus]
MEGVVGGGAKGPAPQIVRAGAVGLSLQEGRGQALRGDPVPDQRGREKVYSSTKELNSFSRELRPEENRNGDSSAALFTHVRRKLAKPWGGDVRFRATKLKLCVSRCCSVGAVSSSGPTMAKSHVTFATDYSFPLIITCVHFLAWFSYSNQKQKKSDCHLPFPTAQESGHVLMRLYLR